MELADMRIKEQVAKERSIIFKVPYSLDKSETDNVNSRYPVLPPVLTHEFPLVSMCESSTSLAFYTASLHQGSAPTQYIEKVVYKEAPPS